MEYIHYTSNAYTKEEYEDIKRHNREYFRYCINSGKEVYAGDDNEIKYIISIDGQVYYLLFWKEGIRDLKNKYGIKIPVKNGYITWFTCSNALPNYIDYMIYYAVSGKVFDVAHYLSKEAVFTARYTDSGVTYRVYKGEVDKIQKGDYGL